MIKDVLAVVRLLPRVNRWQSLLFALLILISSVLPVGMAVCTGLLVGSIPAALALENGFASVEGQAALRYLAIAAGLIVLLRVISPLQGALAASLGRGMDRYLQEKALKAVGRPSGIAHLEDTDILDRLRIVRGLGMDNNRPSLAISGLSLILPAWIQALGSAVVLLWFHWWVGLAWLVLWPFLVYFMQREYLKVGQVGYGQSSALRRAEYFRDLTFIPPAGKEIRIWGMLDWVIGRFQTAWLSAIEPVWKARQPSPVIIFGTSGAVVLINLLSFGLLAWSGAQGNISLAALAVFIQALQRANGYTAFDDGNAYLSFAAVAVPKILDLDQKLQQGSPPITKTLPEQAPRAGIRFQDVRFRYPGAETDAINHLDLVIPAGRSLAIVGENGAGKTSLVKLLCGLYEPSAGQITVDGLPVSQLDPTAWRERVAVLFQDFTHYHLSVRENIAFGAPRLAGDSIRLRSAAEKAGALELIESLPHGWDTILSPEYKEGVDLSGGQWQRIALARALFAVEAGARVLILDEPTAALDVRAEAELYDRFLEITAGLTTILISHRFSTVRRADTIVVLSDGAAVEAGTHEGLLALNGRYADMFGLQAARFTEGDEAPLPLYPEEANA